jgi:hypothetical protein
MKMTTHTFYVGEPKPRVAVGINQCRLAEFAEKYRCWHTHASNRATRAAIAGLVRRGLIETREHNGFRWRQSK